MDSLYTFLSNNLTFLTNYSLSFSHYLQIGFFYLPLGIIGIWRWSVWIIRKTISLFYKMPRGNFNSTLSIVTPVYNESPETFRVALDSWKANQPDEIIAVIDYSDLNSIEVFKGFARGFRGARL